MKLYLVGNAGSGKTTFAKEFGIENLPVSSVKSKLGHTMGAAGMDQIWLSLIHI